MRNSLTILFFLVSVSGFGQLAGTKTIPGDYPTLAAAVTALNTSGVGTGGVTFNIAAGYTETSDIPAITATGTASDSIVFQKSGLGNDPKFIPLTPGTKFANLSSDGDAIITIVGGSYITFDGIDLQTDTSFTTTGMIDFGFYFKRALNNDGSQYITIKNCSVTLSNSDPNYSSFGIYFSDIQGTTPDQNGGNSSNEKIYNNTISNCYCCIELSNTRYPDLNNSIGVDGAIQ